jgi:hypothetical protein
MKIHTRARRRGLVAVMITLQLATIASAAAAEEGCDERKARRGPPAEAFEACANAQEGASCSFYGRREEAVTGTCEFMRDDFVCVPEGHRERGGSEEESRS